MSNLQTYYFKLDLKVDQHNMGQWSNVVEING